MCLNSGLLGVLGRFEKKGKNGDLLISINKEIEENKIHDPFIAQNILSGKNQNSQK